MYLNGFSSSLPWAVQFEALSHIPALRNVQAYRPGYAIEYDFFDPTQLTHTLETKLVSNLFFAGQVNGTTGYEEAAGQGLVAGVNAAIAVAGGQPFTLGRDEAYIGVLIDDLVTKGVDEPYRMFTSRAEHRILLRQDDADVRLTPRGEQFGFVSTERVQLLRTKIDEIDKLTSFIHNYSVKPADVNTALEAIGESSLKQGCKLHDLLLRPGLDLRSLMDIVPALRETIDGVEMLRRDEILEATEIKIKYAGYIERESMIASKLQRLDVVKLRGKFNYEDLRQLSTEARQKLTRIDPETVGQASRIPGISPSDINILLLLLGR